MNQLSKLAYDAPEENTVPSSMQLYYRHRRNGAVVYRMEVSNRQRRIELNPIGSITRDGEVVPHKRRPPTDAEIDEMRAWWGTWSAKAAADELNDTEKFLMQLNHYTDWLQRSAPDEVVDDQSDPILMALLDLRQVIVRRLASIPREDSSSSD